jgi:hypothetical protein
MKRTRWVAISAAALAVVFGGGAALAASGPSNPASDFLGDVAKRLGISEDRLEGAIEEATIARIDEAVAAGDITKAEGDALKERVRSGEAPAILPSFRGPGAPPPEPHKRELVPGFLPGSDLIETAAHYLGIDEADVREALRDGRSLADLARDRGKSVDGLERALVDAIREDAERAVDDGVLPKAGADRLVEKLGSAVEKIVEGGLDFDFRGGPGNLEFRFRVEPAHRVPAPAWRATGPSIVPPRPS